MKHAASMVLFCLAGLASTPAFATARFDCTIADADLTLDVTGIVGDGLGGVISGFAGTLAFSDALLGERLPTFELTGENLPHHWLFDGEFRLHVHVPAPATTALGDLDLALVTIGGGEDETHFSGEYRLHLLATGHDVLEVRHDRVGRVTCVMG